jgi:Sec-independent protein translocase protein TatA
LCSQCNTSYICAQIARPPSVRAKLALTKLAKGFAYLRGSNKVDLIDIEKAFPLVYWKRTVLMDDGQVANRLERLQRLARELMTEIREVKKAMDLVEELKQKFDLNKYRELERWVNSKIWLTEVKEDLDAYYETLSQQLKEKAKGADVETRYKIYMFAKLKLPPDMAKEFELCEGVEIELTNENLAKLATIDANLFRQAKQAMEAGVKKFILTGEHAFKWVLKK